MIPAAMKSTFLRVTFTRASLRGAGPAPAPSFCRRAAAWWWMRVTAAIPRPASLAFCGATDGKFITENRLWHNLFGLLFWEELFESGQLHSGFDWVPHCLKNRTFPLLFEGQIETKLARVRAG